MVSAHYCLDSLRWILIRFEIFTRELVINVKVTSTIRIFLGDDRFTPAKGVRWILSSLRHQKILISINFSDLSPFCPKNQSMDYEKKIW